MLRPLPEMAEEKLGYLLENPRILCYRDAVKIQRCGQSAGNLAEVLLARESSETTCRASTREEILHKAIQAYLQGALGDATFNRLHKTYRFSQKDREWLLFLKDLFAILGQKSWIYKEGKKRSLYALETTAKFLNLRFDPSRLETEIEKIAYVRGYFDAEGGIPYDLHARFYVQFCQKNKLSIEKVKFILEKLKVECGKIHNPSKRADPHYWRFFIKANSYGIFINKIGSWHPGKQNILVGRMKI